MRAHPRCYPSIPFDTRTGPHVGSRAVSGEEIRCHDSLCGMDSYVTVLRVAGRNVRQHEGSNHCRLLPSWGHRDEVMGA